MATVGSGKYTYEYVPNWAKMPAGQEMGTASAIATDSQDRVYLFQRKNPPVLVFDRNGMFIKMDKAEVLREIKEQFARPVEGRALEAKKLAQGLTPFVQEFYKDWGKAEITPHYGYNSRV